MYIKSKQIDTYQYYKEVHGKMKNLYNDNGNDIVQAKDLQSFLYTIKSIGRQQVPGQGLVNVVALNIWETAQKLGHLKTGTILNRTGGRALEQDLSNIILAVLPEQIRKQVYNNINVGGKHFNINSKDLKILSIDDIAIAMSELRPDLKTYTNMNQRQYLTLRSTQGKVDVAGPEATLTLNIHFDNPELAKYYSLLSDATFTAKNYQSISTGYYKLFGQVQRDLDADFPNLHLGNSDPYKAVFSSLQFLGYPSEIIKSAFYAAYWRVRYKNTESDDIASHIWHLRFAYELTGRGSVYLDSSLSGLNTGARFLIYNDPSSDFISVTSTGQLIKEILLDSNIKDNPFTNAVTIAKSHLRNISRG